jgi:hypothetical protein
LAQGVQYPQTDYVAGHAEDESTKLESHETNTANFQTCATGGRPLVSAPAFLPNASIRRQD